MNERRNEWTNGMRKWMHNGKEWARKQNENTQNDWNEIMSLALKRKTQDIHFGYAMCASAATVDYFFLFRLGSSVDNRTLYFDIQQRFACFCFDITKTLISKNVLLYIYVFCIKRWVRGCWNFWSIFPTTWKAMQRRWREAKSIANLIQFCILSAASNIPKSEYFEKKMKTLATIN